MDALLYNIMAWFVGDHENPMFWEPILVEMAYVFAISGVIAGFLFHFTNTRNLNSQRQNRYFMKVGGMCLLILAIYSAIRLFVSLSEFVRLSNYLRLIFWCSLVFFLLSYMITFYLIWFSTGTKKKYVPTLLTGFLKPKKQK